MCHISVTKNVQLNYNEANLTLITSPHLHHIQYLSHTHLYTLSQIICLLTFTQKTSVFYTFINYKQHLLLIRNEHG